MTNILALPQLPADWPGFTVVTDGDFRVGIQFLADVTADPPTPLAIDGIAFEATIRKADDLETVLIAASTAGATMTVDGAEGIVAFAVPAVQLAQLEEGAAIGDLVAIGDGMRINLCQDNGPLQFTIRRGLTS